MNAAAEQTWPQKRMRFLTRRRLSDDQRQALDNSAKVTFLPMENIGEQGELDCSIIRDIDDVENGYTRFFDGDVLVAKITPCFENGKGALVRNTLSGAGFGTTELHVLTAGKEIDARYLYYITVSDHFRRLGEAAMFGAAGQKRVPEDFVWDYPVPVPPLAQQSAIAKYLDRETKRLDTLIVAKQRLLELLAEERQALITRAVTRGLYPSTTKRTSGLSWIDEVPAHWEIWKIGHLAAVGNGSTPSRNNDSYWAEEGIPWLNSGVVNQPEITSADQFVTKLATRRCHLPMVGSGAVLIAITGQGKTRGQVSVLSISATISQHLAFIQPMGHRLRPWFLKWVLVAAYDFLRSISDDGGGTKGALTCEQIANLRVPVPPLNEQDEILSQVTAAVTKMEALQSVVDRAISIIKERRAAVISNAVTGTFDLGSAT